MTNIFCIWFQFRSLKIMCTHVRQNFWKVSSNFEHHSKPTMYINSQHHNLLGNQISYLGYHGNGRHFEFVQPPKAVTYHGGYSYKGDHNMAPKPWISIPNIKIFHQTSWNFVGMSTVVCGSFLGVEENSKWRPLPWEPTYKMAVVAEKCVGETFGGRKKEEEEE
jgi:hypothetical protein